MLKPPARSLLCFLLCMAFSGATQADMQSDMEGMFGKNGGTVNTTAPSSFNSQVANGYQLGSFSARMPNSQLPYLVDVQFPHVKSGCSGIDAYAGSFSFINKTELITLAKNIGNNAKGLAFDLALHTLTPDLEQQISKLRSIVTAINRANMDSCSASKALVGGVAGAISSSVQGECAKNANGAGKTDDADESKWWCNKDASAVSDFLRGRANDPVAAKEMPIEVKDGDFVYMILKDGNVPQLERQLFKSIIGTVVISHPDREANGDKIMGPSSKPVFARAAPTLLTIKALLPDIDAAIVAAQSPGHFTTTVRLLEDNCAGEPGANKSEACKTEDIQFTDFREEVRSRVNALKSAILSNTRVINYAGNNANIDTVDPKGIYTLINNVPLPLLKMAITDVQTGGRFTEKLNNVIALEFLKSIINRRLMQITARMGIYTTKSGMETEYFKEFITRAENFSREINKPLEEEYVKLQSEVSIADFMQKFDDTYRGQFPAIASAMRFEQQNRAGQ